MQCLYTGVFVLQTCTIVVEQVSCLVLPSSRASPDLVLRVNRSWLSKHSCHVTCGIVLKGVSPTYECIRVRGSVKTRTVLVRVEKSSCRAPHFTPTTTTLWAVPVCRTDPVRFGDCSDDILECRCSRSTFLEPRSSRGSHSLRAS